MIRLDLTRLMTILLLSILHLFSVVAAEQTPYQIGYFQHDYFSSYDGIFKAFKQALINKEWADKFVFPEEAQISPGTKDEKILKAKAQQLLERKDLAAIIVMGTSATRAIRGLSNPNKIPIFADGVSDAKEFIINERDSGEDYFTIRVIPEYYERMFKIFHSEVLFKTMGVMYTNLKERNNQTGLDNAEAVAEKRGFAVIPFSLADNNLSDNTEGCLTGLRELVNQGIQAFYIPSLKCFDWKQSDVKLLLEFLTDKKIPTFAKQGPKDVKAGAMMGFSSTDYAAVGKQLADNLFNVLTNKVKPRALQMVDNSPPRLTLNLAAAEKIGYEWSFDTLGASDEIYEEIILPADRFLGSQ